MGIELYYVKHKQQVMNLDHLKERNTIWKFSIIRYFTKNPGTILHLTKSLNSGTIMTAHCAKLACPTKIKKILA